MVAGNAAYARVNGARLRDAMARTPRAALAMKGLNITVSQSLGLIGDPGASLARPDR